MNKKVMAIIGVLILVIGGGLYVKNIKDSGSSSVKSLNSGDSGSKVNSGGVDKVNAGASPSSSVSADPTSGSGSDGRFVPSVGASDVTVYESPSITNASGVKVYYGKDWLAGMSKNVEKLIYGNTGLSDDAIDPRSKEKFDPFILELMGYFTYESKNIADGKLDDYEAIRAEYQNIYNNAYQRGYGVVAPLTSAQKKAGLKPSDPVPSTMYTIFNAKDASKVYCLLDGRYIGIAGERPGVNSYYLYFGSCVEFLNDFQATHPDYNKIG